jgi:hypothetical protein
VVVRTAGFSDLTEFETLYKTDSVHCSSSTNLSTTFFFLLPGKHPFSTCHSLRPFSGLFMMFEAFGFMQERTLHCRKLSQLPSGGAALVVLDPLSLNISPQFFPVIQFILLTPVVFRYELRDFLEI